MTAITRPRPHRRTDGSRPDVAARNLGRRIFSRCRQCTADRRRPSGRMGGGLGLCENCYASRRRSR